MAKKIGLKRPKKPKNTKGILGNKLVGPSKLGISAAAAVAPGAGAGGAGK